MPFADEPSLVVVVDYRPGWPEEFERLAATRSTAQVGPDR